MEKIIKTQSIMQDIINNSPSPRPSSIILAVSFWALQGLGTLTHTEFNLWLASCVSAFAAIRYISDFIKWFKNRNK